ncbi:hypothetical protein BD779DRAFT_790976 [Infundibulicybe gibba]|nr:hypothetical protein BD779DRAFT_790976 [Infundibulicybe gibba]
MVNNWSPAHQIRRTYHFRELVRSLRDRDGSKHPERWPPGVWHSSLPLRPDRWIKPSLRDPLPPPSQCQLNPFLQHIQYSPTPYAGTLGNPPLVCFMNKRRDIH